MSNLIGRTFPNAHQPDIVRSAQKDDYFKKSLYDNLYELAQHYLGTICGQ